MATEPVIGWDLGGAHVKAARLDASGAVERVLQVPCALWQGIEHLDAALEEVLSVLLRAPLHAVTMTGEMVDLFPNRQEGVARLVAALRERLPHGALRFYAGADGFLTADQTAAALRRIASANWMASAALVAARVREALLIDIGSTTTDLAAVRGGLVCSRGRDDAERLVAGELLYSGVVRTPLMALADRVPFDGEWVPLMAEHFATAADVHRLTGNLPDGADQHAAADGGEKTMAGSARRLARMLGRDVEEAPLAAWRRVAAWLAQAQVRRIEDAWERLLSRDVLAEDAPVVVAGVGRFLAADLARRHGRASLEFGCLVPAKESERGRATDCAPAVAVAWLAQRGSAAPDLSRALVGGAPPER